MDGRRLPAQDPVEFDADPVMLPPTTTGVAGTAPNDLGVDGAAGRSLRRGKSHCDGGEIRVECGLHGGVEVSGLGDFFFVAGHRVTPVSPGLSGGDEDSLTRTALECK